MGKGRRTVWTHLSQLHCKLRGNPEEYRRRQLQQTGQLHSREDHKEDQESQLRRQVDQEGQLHHREDQEDRLHHGEDLLQRREDRQHLQLPGGQVRLGTEVSKKLRQREGMR